MRFSVQEYVRWEDIDAAGIINYQAYLRFFGLAEVELFRHCGLTYRTLFDDLGIWLPRVHVECDFYHPVTLDELLKKEGVKHEYHLYSGDHSLTYFLSHFAEVMEFHSRAFGLLNEK